MTNQEPSLRAYGARNCVPVSDEVVSGREWKPGDVALVRLDADTEIRCIRGKRGLGWFSARGTLYDPALDARPLVVIDPEDRETVREIADAAYPEGAGNTNRLQNALREFANPPKREVYEHLVLGELSMPTTATSLCGKVWAPSSDVTVVGRCPACASIADKGWVA